MTVVQASELSYFGLAADSKPAAATRAKFYETDSGREYIYTGSAWVQFLSPSALGARNRFIGQLLAILGDCRLLFLPDGADTTTSTDQSLNGRTLTHSATIAARLSRLGDGYEVSFNATDQYAQTPDVANLTFGTGAADAVMSIVALATVTDSAAARTLVAKYAGTAREWLFGIDTADKLQFLVYDESVDVAPVRVSTPVVTQASPTLFGVTYDGTGGATAMNGATLYENGLVKTSTATNNASYVAMEDTAAVVAIGALSTLTQQMFGGKIDLVAVTAKALTAADHWAIRKLCEGYFRFLG